MSQWFAMVGRAALVAYAALALVFAVAAVGRFMPYESRYGPGWRGRLVTALVIVFGWPVILAQHARQ